MQAQKAKDQRVLEAVDAVKAHAAEVVDLLHQKGKRLGQESEFTALSSILHYVDERLQKKKKNLRLA